MVMSDGRRSYVAARELVGLGPGIRSGRGVRGLAKAVVTDTTVTGSLTYAGPEKFLKPGPSWKPAINQITGVGGPNGLFARRGADISAACLARGGPETPGLAVTFLSQTRP